MAAAAALSRQPLPLNLFAAASGFYINYLPLLVHHTLIPSTSYLLSHTWSLAVEEHFYLFLPLLLIFLVKVRGNIRLIPFIFAGIAAICLAGRIVSHPVEAFATHLRMDSLFAGVTLGYLQHFKRKWFQRLTSTFVLPLVLLIMLLPAGFAWESRLMQTAGLSSLWLGFSLLVAWCSVRRPSTVLSQVLARFLARMGFYSYSIYLWHAPIAVLFRFWSSASAVSFWAYVVTAISVGAGMSRVIEQPILRLRDVWSASERYSPSLVIADQTTVSVP